MLQGKEKNRSNSIIKMVKGKSVFTEVIVIHMYDE